MGDVVRLCSLYTQMDALRPQMNYYAPDSSQRRQLSKCDDDSRASCTMGEE